MASDLSLETKTCKRCGLKGYYIDRHGLCIECGKIWKEEREKRGRQRRRRAGRAVRKEIMVAKVKVRRKDMKALKRLRRIVRKKFRAGLRRPAVVKRRVRGVHKDG